MFVPSWALRIAPYVGGLLLIVAACLWGYNRGVGAERAKWQAEQARAEKAAAAKTAALQAQVDAAGVALSEKQAEIDNAARTAASKTKVFYAANPVLDVRCLTDDRLRAISESDTAAFAFTAAAR